VVATSTGLDIVSNFVKHSTISAIMAVAGLIAGLTPLGRSISATFIFTEQCLLPASGSVAYTTLMVLGKSGNVGRDFSFLLQSMGMVLASVWIYLTGVPVEPDTIKSASSGGAFGVIIGTLVVDSMLPSNISKVCCDTRLAK
jgi:hypothetical protein